MAKLMSHHPFLLRWGMLLVVAGIFFVIAGLASVPSQQLTIVIRVLLALGGALLVVSVLVILCEHAKVRKDPISDKAASRVVQFEASGRG